MDFHSMKRKELQALCKQHSIRANSTNLEMANKLTDLFKEKENEAIDTIEVSTETESCKKVKKVRFSPENEVIEFTRSHKMKRSRRSMVVCSKSNLSVEELNGDVVDRPVKTRSRGKKALENVDNVSKKGKEILIVDDKSEKQAIVGKIQDKPVGKTLTENIDNVRKSGRPRALVDKVESHEIVGKIEDVGMHSIKKALTENVDNVRKRGRPRAAVGKTVNQGDVVGNDANGLGKTSKSKGIVSERNLAIDVEMKNDGKGKEEALEEPQNLARRSKMSVSTAGSSKLEVEATNVGAEVTGKGKVETVVQNQESEKVLLRRSRRKSVMPSHALRNLESEVRNDKVVKPGGVVRTSRRKKLDPTPVSSMIETKEQSVELRVIVDKNTTRSKRQASNALKVSDEFGGDDIVQREKETRKKNTTRSKRQASNALEVSDEFGGDDIEQREKETRKKKKINVSKKDALADDSSHNMQSITGVSDVKKPSCSMTESINLESLLQVGVTERIDQLAAQLSVPEVTSGSKHECLGDDIALTDNDENHPSRMKDLYCEEVFSDILAEKAHSTVESDVQVSNEESIIVADNDIVAAQVTNQTEIPTSHANREEVTENLIVCENEASPENILLAEAFTFDDQTVLKTDLEVLEAEAEESIGQKDLLDLVSEHQGVRAQENPGPVEPVFVNDVSLPIGREHGSVMELLVAPSPCQGTDAEKMHNFTTMQWSETENSQTNHDLSEVNCLEESFISQVQSNEETAYKSGASKNSGDFDASFDQSQSHDKDVTDVNGEKLAVSNISGDNMSMEKIMAGEHEAAKQAEEISNEYKYEPASNRNCGKKNEGSVEVHNAHVESSIGVSDVKKQSSSMRESILLEGLLQDGVTEHRDPLAAQLSLPEVTSGSIQKCLSDGNSLTDMDENEPSVIKDLSCAEDFPDMVTEKAQSTVESDVRVLNEESIIVAENDIVAAQMTNQTDISTLHASCEEVTENSNVCENEVSPEHSLLAGAFTFDDQTVLKISLEGIEAEAKESIGPQADLLDFVSENQGVSAPENPGPVEPLFINDICLPIGREHGSDMELLVAPSPYHGTDTKKTHDFTTMRWSETEISQTNHDLREVNCLEKSFIRPVQSIEDTADESGAPKNSGGYDALFDQCQSDVMKISGEKLPVSNISGDNMSMEQIMAGQYEATKHAEEISIDCTYESASNQNCSRENEDSIEVHHARVESSIGVSDVEKPSSSMRESFVLEGLLQDDETEHRDPLAAQLSLPEVTSGSKQKCLSDGNSITDMDENEPSRMKYLSCAEDFPDMVTEKAHSTVESDILVLNEKSIIVADNDIVVPQMTNQREISAFHANCEEVTENSNVCENEVSPENSLLAGTFTCDDQTVLKISLASIEAEADESIGPKANLMHFVSEDQGVCAPENPGPVEPVFINDVSLAHGREYGSEMELLVAPSPCHGTDTKKTHNFTTMRLFKTENSLTNHDLSEVNCLEESCISPVQSNEDTVDRSGAPENSGGYDASFDQCQSDDKDVVTEISGEKLAVSNISGDNMSVEKIMGGEHEATKQAEEIFSDYTYEPETDLGLPFVTPNKLEACKVDDICDSESKLEEFCLEKLFCTQQKASHEKAGKSYLEVFNTECIAGNNESDLQLMLTTPNNIEFSSEAYKLHGPESKHAFEKCIEFSSEASKLLGSESKNALEECTVEIICPMKVNSSQEEVEVAGLELKNNLCPEVPNSEVLADTKFFDNLACPTEFPVNCEEELVQSSGNFNTGSDNQNQVAVDTLSDNLNRREKQESFDGEMSINSASGKLEVTGLMNAACITEPYEVNLQLLFATPNKADVSDDNETRAIESKLEESCMEKVAPNSESMKDKDLNLVNGLEVANLDCSKVPPVANAFEASKESLTWETYGQKKETDSLSVEHTRRCLGQIYLDEESKDDDPKSTEIISTIASSLENTNEICDEKSLDIDLSENLKFPQSSELRSGFANGDTSQKCSNGHYFASDTQRSNIKSVTTDASEKPTSSEMADDQSGINVVTDQEFAETGIIIPDEPLFSNLEMGLLSGDSDYEISNCSHKKDGKDNLGSSTDEIASKLSVSELSSKNEIDSRYEVLKETDVMETIQEYTNYESSNSFDIDHSRDTLPIDASTEVSKISDFADEPQEDSILDEVSALRGFSTAKKTARTILIHGTPNKVLATADMKENDPVNKKPFLGDITISRPAKRRALQDL